MRAATPTMRASPSAPASSAISQDSFTSAVVLAMIAILIGYEAVMRLMAPIPVQFDEAIAIAVLGLGVNVASVFMLGGGDHDHEHSHHHGSAHDHDHDDHDDHDHTRDHGAHDRPHHHHHHHHHAHTHRDHNLRAALVHVATFRSLSHVTIEVHPRESQPA
jgi:Co/Zn/Cd efflux system component